MPQSMLGRPTGDEQALLADTLQRPNEALSTRERIAEGLSNGGFVVAVALLWILAPPHAVPLAPAIACVPILVLSMRIRIDTPFGFTLPTQLAFVPLLFALPIAIVPIAVAGAGVLARMPDVIKGDL